jgi:hypothetical protein
MCYANSSRKHYKVAIYLLKYLIETKRAGIEYYHNGNLYIIIFADDGADETQRACACHFVIFAGEAV